jgi:SAM-dependent methyltransferase
MPSAAETWNSRYGDPDFHPAARPNPFLLETLPFLSRGSALDLACGAGQNAVALVERGRPTAAIDVSLIALDRAEALARSRGVRVRRAAASSIPEKFPARSAELLLIHADLENFLLPISAFEVILCFRYLQRSLFAAMESALRPGGILVFETFTRDQLSFDRGPRNPDHLLQPGELRSAFPGLDLLFYREWKSSCDAPRGHSPGEAMASLLARKSTPS